MCSNSILLNQIQYHLCQDFPTLFFFRIRIQDLQLQDDLQRAEMKINRLRVEIAKQAKVLEDHYYTTDEEYYYI